jgi:nitrate/TMAO reductase-like tetraheme cytochrome c subunit
MNDDTKNVKKPTSLKNWLTVTGAIISLGGLFAFAFLFFIDTFAHHGNPYMGILAYVIAPGFILGGIAFAIIGAWLHARRLKRVDYNISIDLTRPRDRRIATGFTIGAALFLMVTAFASYQTYHYSESVQFCGQVCHVPMKPEFTAYQASPHAKIDCVDCHVGKGAEAYLKAKINGVHQLKGVLTGDYHHPIKTPVKNMRKAQEICEDCHWRGRDVGVLEKTFNHYLADETNTFFGVRLLMKVGGYSTSYGGLPNIHWHNNPSNKVEFIATDRQRTTIPYVRLTDGTGKVTEYKVKEWTNSVADVKPENGNGNGDGSLHLRRMDCLDCHNRPAHRFSSPNDAVDRAMAVGKIDPSIPWIKSNVVAAVIAPYSTEDEALEKISAKLKSVYPKEPKIDQVIAATHAIFKTNLFPEMKADWRSYPNNIGHKESAGCFRCHDGNHKTADGKKTITANNCNLCHTILAQGNPVDFQKLNPKGHTFFHIDAPNEDFSCNNCHTGAFPKE